MENTERDSYYLGPPRNFSFSQTPVFPWRNCPSPRDSELLMLVSQTASHHSPGGSIPFSPRIFSSSSRDSQKPGMKSRPVPSDTACLELGLQPRDGHKNKVSTHFTCCFLTGQFFSWSQFLSFLLLSHPGHLGSCPFLFIFLNFLRHNMGNLLTTNYTADYLFTLYCID